jgi:hypothetical protein
MGQAGSAMSLKMYLCAVAAGGLIGASIKDKALDGLRVQEEPGRVVFQWTGKVEAPMLDKFKAAFAARADDRRPIVISLDSPGGYVEHGSRLISFILKMQATHSVDTVVEKGGTCASMCVPIYLAGAHRTAHPSARFMFHEVSFSSKVDDELRKLQRETGGLLAVGAAKRYLVNAGTDNLFERYLRTAGTRPEWIERIRREVRGRDVWRTGSELMQQRSGIVHELKAQDGKTS